MKSPCISGCESANYRILFAVFLTMQQKVVFAQMISSNHGHSAPVDASFWSRKKKKAQIGQKRRKRVQSKRHLAAAKCVKFHSFQDSNHHELKN